MKNKEGKISKLCTIYYPWCPAYNLKKKKSILAKMKENVIYNQGKYQPKERLRNIPDVIINRQWL